MTRPDFGKGGVSRRFFCAGMQVLVLLSAGGAWAGGPTPGPDPMPLDSESIGRANERVMVIPPILCRDLGFVPGTAKLSASTPTAIAGIHLQWTRAKAGHNLVSMAVRADASLAGVEAVRQEKRRAAVLGSALVRSRIPQADVIVQPLSSKPEALKLSCPPVD